MAVALIGATATACSGPAPSSPPPKPVSDQRAHVAPATPASAPPGGTAAAPQSARLPADKKLSAEERTALETQAREWIGRAAEEFRYLQTRSGAVHERTTWFVQMREGVSYTAMRDIASVEAQLDMPGAVEATALEPDMVFRAYALEAVASAQHARAKPVATKTIEHALSLVAKLTDEKALALLPLLRRTHAKITGDQSTGTSSSDDDEDALIARSREAAAAGDWKQARAILDRLPAGTFQRRQAHAALMQDRGAEFMARAAALPSKTETTEKLLQWACELGDVVAARAIIKEHAHEPRAWAYGHLMLAQSFRERTEASERRKWLETAWKLSHVEPKPEWGADLSARVAYQMSLEQMPEAKRYAHELQARATGQDWAPLIARALIELGELDAAERMAATLEDADDVYLAIAGYRAEKGDPRRAREVARKVTSKLGPARTEYVIGSALAERGDHAGAEKAFATALELVRKVPVTNAWFPGSDEVNYKQRDSLVAAIHAAQLESGSVEQAMATFEYGRSAIRTFAYRVAIHAEAARATTWAASFDESARDEGARMFAYLGLAEGALGRARD